MVEPHKSICAYVGTSGAVSGVVLEHKIDSRIRLLCETSPLGLPSILYGVWLWTAMGVSDATCNSCRG